MIMRARTQFLIVIYNPYKEDILVKGIAFSDDRCVVKIEFMVNHHVQYYFENEEQWELDNHLTVKQKKIHVSLT